MSLRLKLVLAAAGIVAVSLVLSGAVASLLVRNLELDNQRDELDRTVLLVQQAVRRQECVNFSVAGANACPRPGMVDAAEFKDRLRTRVDAGPGENRLLLLDRSFNVVYDSEHDSAVGSNIPLKTVRALSQDVRVLEGNFTLGATSYLGAGAVIAPARDPLGAAVVVIARNRVPLEARVVSDLLPRLLTAGLIALAFAIVITVLLGRALARPLSELAAAAADIERGDYSRRVAIGGRDEIGIVGNAFNRMAAAVERARAVQRDFVANVSHELKTPLTSLIGFSQALVDGSIRTAPERRRAATIINEEAHRVLRMAQELLDLARVESGQMTLDIRAADLSALLQQQVEVVRPRVQERRLELQLEVPPDLPPVRADVERLHQVLDNLLDNAVKYAPGGTPVTVRAAEAGELVEAVVENQVGAHPPDPDRMFERFYRADRSRASGQAGVGLGLAISRELAVAHGGRLSAELRDGRLTVRLAIPAARPPFQSTPSPTRAADAAAPEPATTPAPEGI